MGLLDICINAFKRGDNYHGETPTKIKEVSYIKLLGQYMVTLELELDGQKSTTDIGIVELSGDKQYRIHSGKKHFYKEKTISLQKELQDNAIVTEI